MKRCAVKTNESEMVALWIPRTLLSLLDSEVMRSDTDRSKLIRLALREKLARASRHLKEAA